MKALVLALATLCVGLTSFVWTSAARADQPLQQGRSAATCSDDVLVCEFYKDGAMIPTSECRAREDQGAVRFLYGDCYDED